MKQTNKNILETRKLKAGRTQPRHKNGGGDSGATQGWFPDYCGPIHVFVSRKAPVAPGMAASTTATRANCQPLGAPGKAGGGWKAHVEIAFMHLGFSSKKVMV